MDQLDLPVRPMRLKILYTFDRDMNVSCLARSSASANVTVAQNLGMVNLLSCLECVCASSPDIALDELQDYAVYSTDYSEYDHPSVGHGLLSNLLNSTTASVNVMGQVTQSASPFYSQETLEVSMQFRPIPCKRKKLSSNDTNTSSLPKRTKLDPPLARPSKTIAVFGNLASSPPARTRTAAAPTPPAGPSTATDIDDDDFDVPPAPNPNSDETGLETAPNSHDTPLDHSPSPSHRQPRTPPPPADNNASSPRNSQHSMQQVQQVQPGRSMQPAQATTQATHAAAQSAPSQPQDQSDTSKRKSGLCSNCDVRMSSTWRQVDIEDNRTVQLCNACGLYYLKHRKMRPRNYWGSVRKPPGTSAKRLKGMLSDQSSSNSNSAAGQPQPAQSSSSTPASDSSMGTSRKSKKSKVVRPSQRQTEEDLNIAAALSAAIDRRKQEQENLGKRNGSSYYGFYSNTNYSGKLPQNSASSPTASTHSANRLGSTSASSPIAKLHIPGSSPLKAYRKEHHKIDNDDDEGDNKENVDPQSKHDPEIDALFATPQKNMIHSDSTLVSGGSPTKWLTKLMASVSRSGNKNNNNNGSGALRGFLDSSPSKNYDDMMKDLGLDLMNHLDSGDTAVNSDLPSSPPSFFYLYDDECEKGA